MGRAGKRDRSGRTSEANRERRLDADGRDGGEVDAAGQRLAPARRSRLGPLDLAARQVVALQRLPDGEQVLIAPVAAQAAGDRLGVRLDPQIPEPNQRPAVALPGHDGAQDQLPVMLTMSHIVELSRFNPLTRGRQRRIKGPTMCVSHAVGEEVEQYCEKRPTAPQRLRLRQFVGLGGHQRSCSLSDYRMRSSPCKGQWRGSSP